MNCWMALSYWNSLSCFCSSFFPTNVASNWKFWSLFGCSSPLELSDMCPWKEVEINENTKSFKKDGTGWIYLMINVWSDRKNRSIIDVFAHCLGWNRFSVFYWCFGVNMVVPIFIILWSKPSRILGDENVIQIITTMHPTTWRWWIFWHWRGLECFGHLVYST